MDPMIKQTIDGMLSSFDYIEVSDPAIKQEIEQYKADMMALGEKHTDVGAFMGELTSSGLMEKNGELMTKASSAPAAAAEAPQDAPSGGGDYNEANLPTVGQFLAQYKAPYDAAKVNPYAPNTIVAYEKIFDVENRTDDLLEMNIILEEEGLLKAPTVGGLMDTYTLHYNEVDHNFIPAREQYARRLNIAKDYSVDEQLYYLTDQDGELVQQEMYSFMYGMIAAIQLSKVCLEYVKCKIGVWSGVMVDKNLSGMIASRESIRCTLETMGKDFQKDFDYYVSDPWCQRFMLVYMNIEGSFTAGRIMHPDNLNLWREVAFTEATSNLTDIECVDRLFENPLHWAIDERIPEDKAAVERMHQEVENRLNQRETYQYYKKINVEEMMSAAEKAVNDLAEGKNE